MMNNLSLHNIHDSWHKIIHHAITRVNPDYLHQLASNDQWLPGPKAIFNAFSIPKEQTRYIMLGESPYPRAQSANGYAFWDNAVSDMWCSTGLSKPVNRATSLRNFSKMLLIAEKLLKAEDTTQQAIAAIDKAPLIQGGAELFQNMLSKGFLLLNASLVLSDRPVRQDAKAWQPFMQCLLTELAQSSQKPQLIMFGNIAKAMAKIVDISQFNCLIAEHPYNQSFIHNQDVIEFFAPLHLLRKI